MAAAENQALEDELALDDAMAAAENQALEDELALDDAMADAENQALEDELALDDAMADAENQALEDELALDDAMDIYDEPEESLDIFDEPVDSMDIYDEPEATIEDNVSTGAYNTSILKTPSLYVASNDFQRLVSNIIENARKHGFTDPNRKDYEIKVSLSIDTDNNRFQIDFRNNGNPLPSGMDKVRYGIKGEKAGKTAGTGIGGYYVRSFVEYYHGDYDIFMEDGWTVVRIYLPIKMI